MYGNTLKTGCIQMKVLLFMMVFFAACSFFRVTAHANVQVGAYNDLINQINNASTDPDAPTEIILMTDITCPIYTEITIPSGRYVVIDLGGYTLKLHRLEINGTLSLKTSESNRLNGWAESYVYLTGSSDSSISSISIGSGGTLNMIAEHSCYVCISSSDYYFSDPLIVVNGNLNIMGGVVGKYNDQSGNCVVINSGGHFSLGEGAVKYLNGRSSCTGVKVNSGGEFEMSGGNIGLYGSSQPILPVDCDGTFTRSGGTIIGDIKCNGSTDVATVTFKDNFSSSNQEIKQYFVKNSDFTLAKNKFDREGYTFAEWNEVADGSGDTTYADQGTANFSGDQTLYAQWNGNITLSTNNIAYGDVTAKVGETTAISAKSGATVILTPTAETGYQFKEWNIIAPANLSITNNSFTMPSEPVSIQAVFEEVPTFGITVTKDPHVASASADYMTATQDITVTLTASVTDPAYEFDKWTSNNVTITNPTSATGATFTMPGQAVTVKANSKLKQTYSIMVSKDGGGTDSAVSADLTSAYSGQTVTLSANAATGYEFSNWTCEAGGVSISNPTSATGASFVMGSSAVSIKAHFNKVYEVTFKVKNGTWAGGSRDDITVLLKGNDSAELKLAQDQIPDVNGQHDEGYKSTGSWDVMPDTTTVITGNTVYTYSYTDQDKFICDITFKVKNGAWDDATTADKTVRLWRYVDEDKALVLSENNIPAVGNKPASGYMRGDWDETPRTDRQVSENKIYTYSYAPSPREYTVAFNANGGAGKMAAVTRTVGDDKVLPANAFIYPRRTFTGWNTQADGTGKSYANGYKGDISKADGTIPARGETITLYAQWDWGEIPEDIRKDIFANDMSKVKADDIWYAFKYEDKWHTDTSGLKKAYTGSKITFTPDIKVFHGFWQLWENRDYTVSYDNNMKAALADASKAPFVKIKGKGSYSASETFNFTIEPADIAAAEITSEETIVADAGAKISSVRPSASYDGKNLKSERDYDLVYYEGSTIDAAKEIIDKEFKLADKGTYLVTLKSKGNYKGEKAAAVIRAVNKTDKSIVRVSSLKVADIKGRSLTIKIPYSESVAGDFAGYIKKYFDNSAAGSTPIAQVMNGKDVLVYGRDYTISVPSGHMSAGKHGIVIKGIETAASGKSYIGSKNVSVEISGTKLSNIRIAGLKNSVEYLGRDIVLADVFNKDDKNLEIGWNTVTLYKVSKNGNITVKTPLKMSTDGVNGDYTLTMVNTGAASYTETYTYPVYKTRTKMVDGEPVQEFYIEWVTETVEKGGRFLLIYNGINGYTGTVKKSVIIRPYNVKEEGKSVKKIKVSIDERGAVYSKAGTAPYVKVEFEDKELREGIDYKLSYKNNRKVVTDLTRLRNGAKPAVIIKGMGNFKGSVTGGYFKIRKADIGAVGTTVSLTADDVIYDPNGKAGYFMVKPVLKDGDTKLSLGEGKDAEALDKGDYAYTYVNAVTLEDGTARAAGSAVTASDKVPAGTAIQVSVRVKCSEKSSYTSESSGTLKTCTYKVFDKTRNIKNAKVSITDGAKKKLVFNNGYTIPINEEDLTVTLGGVQLSSSDYEIVSVKNANLVGRATVMIRGVGSYGGTKKISFDIGKKGI